MRVLLADLAERLGTLGHLTSLRRTAIGADRVEDALTTSALAQRVAAGEAVVRPPVDLLGDMARVTLDAERVLAVRRGQRVAASVADDEVAALDESGALVGVLERRDGRYQPVVVLGPAGADG